MGLALEFTCIQSQGGGQALWRLSGHMMLVIPSDGKPIPKLGFPGGASGKEKNLVANGGDTRD